MQLDGPSNEQKPQRYVDSLIGHDWSKALIEHPCRIDPNYIIKITVGFVVAYRELKSATSPMVNACM